MTQKKTRGFIGPIGDDLPSLIPLIFALVIFFGIFSYSYTVFVQKNTGFDRDIDALNIARILKGTNYISGYQSFSDSCRSLNPTDLKYIGFVTNFFTANEQYCELNGCPGDLSSVKVFSLAPYALDGTQLLCSKGELPEFEFFSQNPYYAKIYPLVVEDNRVVKPMHLVVIAWQE